LSDHFAELTDPRRREVTYPLINVVVIAICAVICGADDFVAIAKWGRTKRDWLAKFLDLSAGIPSHDRFNAILAAIKPAEFEQCLLSWITALHDVTDGQIIAIDGKTLRRSFDKASGKSAIHMVSAWATANHISLGQVVTDQKSNEITAIPKLLELLEIQGSLVTIDAMGCQTEIAGKIERNGGDYVLAVKENQPSLHAALKRNLDEMILENFAGVRHGFVQTVDGDHGRIETRRVWVTDQLDDWLEADQRERWPGLKSVAVVEAKREVPLQKTSVERRYFISSISGTDASGMAQIIRGHWSVENKLHWVLDVSFAEDQSRQRKDHSAENFSRLRRIALNLLRREKTKKRGIKGKRLNAAWDHDYLLKLLKG
jgi:predicted transposase YbfD/YdcC